MCCKQCLLRYYKREELIYQKLIFRLQEKWFTDAIQVKKDVEDLQEISTAKSSEVTKQMDKKYNSSEDGARCEQESKLLNDISNSFLAAANPLIHDIEKRKIENLIITLNAKVKLSLYSATTDERFEWEKAQAKSLYLQALAGIEYKFARTSTCSLSKKKTTAPIKLAEFPDPTCQSKFSIAVGLFKASTTCTKFSFEGGEVVQFAYEEDFETDEIEWGIGIGAAWHTNEKLPLGAELSIKTMGIFQYNKDGYTGGGVKTSASLLGRAGYQQTGALVGEAEMSSGYYINTQHGKSEWKGGVETSVGVKFDK